MESSMTAKFWGVRGSIPSPGVSTARYGGNTSCVSLHLPGEPILVFDAGTGIRELGKALAAGREEIFIVLSHAHSCDLALKAEVKHLILYHHDPDRTDQELDRIQEDARRKLGEQKPRVPCTVAFEGLSIAI